MILCPKCKGQGFDVTCTCGGSGVLLTEITAGDETKATTITVKMCP